MKTSDDEVTDELNSQWPFKLQLSQTEEFESG